MNAPIIDELAFRCFLTIDKLGVASNRELIVALNAKRELVYNATYVLRGRGLVDVYKSSRGELFFRRKDVDEKTFKHHFDRRFWNEWESERIRETDEKQE